MAGRQGPHGGTGVFLGIRSQSCLPQFAAARLFAAWHPLRSEGRAGGSHKRFSIPITVWKEPQIVEAVTWAPLARGEGSRAFPRGNTLLLGRELRVKV